MAELEQGLEQEQNFKWTLKDKTAELSYASKLQATFDLNDLLEVMSKNAEFELQVLYFVCKQKLSNKKADTKGKSLDFKLSLMKDTWKGLCEGEWKSKKEAGYNKEAASDVMNLGDIKLLQKLRIPLNEQQQRLINDVEAMELAEKEEDKEKGKK